MSRRALVWIVLRSILVALTLTVVARCLGEAIPIGETRAVEALEVVE